MSADSPRHSSGGCRQSVPAIVPPQVVSDRSILDSAIGFINDVTLANQPHTDPKDTITWARFESAADISDPRFGEDWEFEGNVAPPLLLILGYGLGVQVWAVPANGEAVEVLSWRHGIVSALRVLPTPASSSAIEENGRADEPVDAFAEKRPLIAMVDGSASAGVQPQFCAVNFVSLKTGAQVKTIKFKNPVLDILANRSSIVITFNERIAVFDARTLEDRLSITTCYPSPGINPNPVALGPRWLAYAEHKLLHSKRSGAGCDGDGVASYTATMLNAAKSFGKGLRELGEQVAMGLTGTTGSGGASKNNSFDSNSGGDFKQPGIITIMDIKHAIKDYSPTSGTPMSGHAGNDPIVAHFIAHSEAVVAVEFDNTGMLLLTADRRGHDFHIFRIQPHPVGSSLAAVHHLYVLHRGDTSAKVQNIAFSLDSRWVAVSTLRGTTHVFPITPYGGAMGVRTHTSLHVVNKLSRFHRSAGLSADGRSSSPISHSESTTFVQSLQPYHNSTLPPFPRPTVVLPLAQLRQPFALGSPPGSVNMAAAGGSKSSGPGGVAGAGSGASQRQRLSSLSDDNGKPLSVCAIFAKSRSWLLDPPNATREAPHRIQRKAVDSLFVMAGHGALIQYDLDTKLASNVAKEKICDDTPIELEVEAKAQWNLGRRKDGSQEIMPPLSLDNWLIKHRNSCMLTDSTRHFDDGDDRAESWLSQVEIITHAGPHRRLWMGPQFVFKTYNTPSGSNLSHVDVEAVEIGVTKAATTATATTTRVVERSSPLNMPLSAAGRSAVPVLIESGSYSSIEQSPKLMDRFRHEHLDSDFAVAHGDTRLKEDLADAMRESPSVSAARKDTGRLVLQPSDGENVPFYDALAEHEDEEQSLASSHRSTSSAAALASVLPNISSYESVEPLRKHKVSVEKVVNTFGTVTTVTSVMSAELQTDILDEVVSQLAAEDVVIHENCDEALFRPVVAIFCDEETRKRGEEEALKNKDLCKPPEVVGNKLIVPVIAKEVDAEICKKEKQKSDAKRREQDCDKDVQKQFAEFSTINKRSKSKSNKESSNVKVEIKNTNVLKTVEKRKIKTSVDEQSVIESSRANTKYEFIEPKVNESEHLIKEEINSEVKPSKTDVLDDEKKPTTTKKVEEKIEVEKDLQKKEPSKKSKRKSEERELKLSHKLMEEEPTLELKNMTSVPVENPIQQTAGNAKTQSAKEKTATASENKIISKAATKQKLTEIKTTSKSEAKEQTKKDLSSKTNKVKIETEFKETKKLSVADLADSLIEITDEEKETTVDVKLHTAYSTEKKTTSKVEDNANLDSVSEPMKPIKQNRSESNSDTEEVVKVLATKTNKSQRKSVDLITENKPLQTKKQLENKSSESSDDSTDLADSLLDNKSIMKDTLFVSFTQAEPTSDSIKIETKQVNLEKNYTSKNDTSTKLTKLEDETINIEYIAEKDDYPSKNTDCVIPNGAGLKDDAKHSNVNLPTLQKEERTINEINTLKKTGNTELKKSEEENKSVCCELMDDVKVLNLKDHKENQLKETNKGLKDKSTFLEKAIESKGAIKKEYNKEKETYKIKDSAEKLQVAVKKKNVFEIVNKSDLKAVETKINKELKSSILPEIDASKKPKKKLEYLIKDEVEVLHQPVDSILHMEERTLRKSKNYSKLEEVKVITEQVTKKSVKEEGQPLLHRKPDNLSFLEMKTEDPIETACAIDKKDKAQNIFKVILRKPSSAEDVTDGFATSSKNKINESSLSEKSRTTKDMETKVKSIDTTSESPTTVWQTLSGAKMILKNLDSVNTGDAEQQYPSLGKMEKNKKATKPTQVELESKHVKLLPDLPTPLKLSPDFKSPIGVTKINSRTKKMVKSGFDDYPLLKPLETLPPLPTLEPLELLSDAIGEVMEKDTLAEQMSLINFESPEKQENLALDRKITPSPRGFTEQNLIFALCGSLHYENESLTTTKREATPEKSDLSPTLPLTQSTTDYKLLTENDDAYMSLEQSSQETNTTTNDKLSSSSPNSSSEEIVVLEEKKITKKQKRKKQQIELQKKKEQQLNDSINDVDEELRPLIAMSDSQLENFVTSREHLDVSLPAPSLSRGNTALLMDASFSMSHVTATVSRSEIVHYTTTDSEGPMPATTSDDNGSVYTLPTALMTSSAPNKLKTKKLEHKINLIAAIEAATSSSTSSAEESGQEAGVDNGRASEMDVSPPLITIAASVAQHERHQIPPIAGATTAMQSAAKKKTKRRKR